MTSFDMTSFFKNKYCRGISQQKLDKPISLKMIYYLNMIKIVFTVKNMLKIVFTVKNMLKIVFTVKNMIKIC